MAPSTGPVGLPPLTWWGAMRWAAVAPHLPRRPDAGVVEFGCGLGAFGARLAARYGRYVGVEPDPASAAVARERIAPWSGRVLAAAHDVPAGSADLLCAFEVLEHLEDDAGALTEWRRAAAPGARVIVSVPAEPDRYGPWDEKVGHYRRYSRTDLAALLRAAGAEPTAVLHYGYPFGYALEGARNLVARRQAAATRTTPMAARTESSGRQRQAGNAAMGAIRWSATAPFRAWQARRPDRGPGLVGVGRLPG